MNASQWTQWRELFEARVRADAEVIASVSAKLDAAREACAVIALNTCLGGDSCPCALQIAAAIRTGGEK